MALECADDIVFATLHSVAWGAAQPSWKFTGEDVEHVEGQKLVSLNPKNHSLLSFIMGDKAEMKLARQTRLKHCTQLPGYRQLMELRNVAQATALTPACTLFATEETKAAKQASSRSSSSALIDVSFELDGTTVSVVMRKPTSSRDTLQIEFTQIAVKRVIHYIRGFGFGRVDVNARNQDGPKGVWKRKATDGSDMFIVQHGTPSKRHYARFGSVEDALVRLSTGEWGDVPQASDAGSADGLESDVAEEYPVTQCDQDEEHADENGCVISFG